MYAIYMTEIDIGSACLRCESWFGPVFCLWDTHTTRCSLLSGVLQWLNFDLGQYCSIYKAVPFFCWGDIKSGNVTYRSTESQEHWRNTLFWIALEKAVFTRCLDLLFTQRAVHGKARGIASILWLVVLKSLNLERLSTVNCTVSCVWIFPCGKTWECGWRTKPDPGRRECLNLVNHLQKYVSKHYSRQDRTGYSYIHTHSASALLYTFWPKRATMSSAG